MLFLWECSPQYGQYKEARELNELTAADPQHVKDSWSFFESNGAKCKAFWSHLECRASVADVERIFKASMYEHEHKESGVKVSRVSGEYSFPAELQGKVEFVTGLTQLPVGRYGRVNAAISDYSVVPETLYSLYNINADGNSAVTQSAIEFQGYPAVSDSDLATFIRNTGIPSFTLKNKIGPYNPSFPGAESTLDVQYLGAVGRKNTNWYWTESQWLFDFSNSVLQMSRSELPDVMSMSYGWNEEDQCQIDPSSAPCSQGGNIAYVQRVNTNFQKIGAMGISLLASSGDSGAHGRSDRTCNGDTLHPAFPASSPYVTAVGATMFDPSTVQTGGSEPVCQGQLKCATGGTEVVCTTKNGAALITSGGGFSNVASIKDYQKDVVQAYLAKGQPTLPPVSDFNSSGRGYPDVSAFGHAYYIELDGQLQQVDGTSASCPVFAGIVSLLNAYRRENNKATIGFANPLLYKVCLFFRSTVEVVVHTIFGTLLHHCYIYLHPCMCRSLRSTLAPLTT